MSSIVNKMNTRFRGEILGTVITVPKGVSTVGKSKKAQEQAKHLVETYPNCFELLETPGKDKK